MGIDIYAGRGVVVTVEEFLKVINGKNKSNVVSVCHTFHQDLVKDARQNPDDNWRTEISNSFKPLGGLKSGMKLSEIREIIASVVTVKGEPSKYGSCYVDDSEYVADLFTRILDACPEADDLPPIQEIEAWGSSRYNGYDVPKGVACVVFDSEYCFKRTLSKQGKVVEKLFGHCDETEWTEYSV